MGLLHSRSKSQERFKMSGNVCLDDIFLCVQSCPLSISWTTQLFFTKFGIVVYYHEAMCHVAKLVHCLQCQGHSEGLYNQNMTFLLCLLYCLVICNETLFDSTASQAGVSSGKKGLLLSRSSHSEGSILVNVCLDDIFWATKCFLTKPDTVLQHCKP